MSYRVRRRDVNPRPASHLAAAVSGRLGDFTTSPRVLLISAIAIVVGTGGSIAGVVLLHLIRLFTNIAYFGRSYARPTCRSAHSPLGWPRRGAGGRRADHRPDGALRH